MTHPYRSRSFARHWRLVDRQKMIRWSIAIVAVVLLGLASSVHAQTQAKAKTDSPARADDVFVKIIAHARPSVVAVGSYTANERPSVRYYGTGFSIFDGTLVVTNQHVIDAMVRTNHLKDLRLYLPDTRSAAGLTARVVASDAHHDVALLQVDTPILPPLELELARKPKQGETVGVLGYPIGMALGVVPAVHKGVISAVVPAVLPLPRGVKLTPELAEAIRRPYDLYQLDMVVYPGNSGSPLLDGQTGRVLGIVNKTLATKTREHLLDKPSGISYAVPVKWIRELVARTIISLDKKSDDK